MITDKDIVVTMDSVSREVVVRFHSGWLVDWLGLLASGICTKKLQLAYELECNNTLAAELLDEHIQLGQVVYDKLEALAMLNRITKKDS